MEDGMNIDNGNNDFKNFASEEKLNEMTHFSMQEEYMNLNTPQGPNFEQKDGSLQKNAQIYNEMQSIRSNSNDKVSKTHTNSEWEKPYSASKKHGSQFNSQNNIMSLKTGFKYGKTQESQSSFTGVNKFDQSRMEKLFKMI